MRSGERSKRSIGWPGKGHTRPSVRRDAQGYVYIGTDSVCVCVIVAWVAWGMSCGGRRRGLEFHSGEV